VAGCPSSHQPTRIREERLESGGPLQQKLNFRLRMPPKMLLLVDCLLNAVGKQPSIPLIDLGH
jgi:hypothetical protein